MVRRIVGALLALGAALMFLAFSAPAAHGQSDAAERITGKVFNERLENDQTVRDPVEGVKILVTTPDGGAVGEATTDAEGGYEIPLPGQGTYVLAIDEASVPAGVAVKPEDAKRTIDVRPEQSFIGNFFLGEDTRKVEGRFSRLPQTIFDGLFFGLIIAICSVGLSLIYGTTGLSNFAHGEMVTFGAVIGLVVNTTMGVHLLLATPIAIAAGALGGWVFNRGIWQELRRRRTSLTSQMIASIGLALFIRFFIQYTFGPRTESYAQYQNQTNPIDLGPISFPPRVFVSLLICIVVLVAIALFLQRTRFGKAIRAVSDNPDLASATGINTNRVISIVWVLGGALAGLGGVLLGLDQKVRWDSGAGLLLLMFAAITLGGLGSAYGALAGSLVIGLAVEMSAWLFPDYIDLKRTGALVVLIVVLLVRPQGILGRRERIG